MTAKEERVHFRIPAEAKARLEALAKARGLSVSVFLRRLILGLETVPPAE